MAAWFTGYFVCWALKWSLVAATTGIGVVNHVMIMVKQRLFGDHEVFEPATSAGFSIMHNLGEIEYRLWIFVTVLAAGFVASLVRWRSLAVPGVFRRGVSVPALLFLLPFAWLSLLQNHSILHQWYVATILVTSIALVYELVWIRGRSAA